MRRDLMKSHTPLHGIRTRALAPGLQSLHRGNARNRRRSLGRGSGTPSARYLSMNAEHESVGHAGRSREISERREHERTEFAAPALLDAASSWHKAVTENFSLGGVKVRTDAILLVGKELEVYFE